MGHWHFVTTTPMAPTTGIPALELVHHQHLTPTLLEQPGPGMSQADGLTGDVYPGRRWWDALDPTSDASPMCSCPKMLIPAKHSNVGNNRGGKGQLLQTAQGPGIPAKGVTP